MDIDSGRRPRESARIIAYDAYYLPHTMDYSSGKVLDLFCVLDVIRAPFRESSGSSLGE